ncbi:LOW QUALITY PROTEIN: hypothetical protein V2J09_003016 [Rumex salicifolius]
MPKSDPTLIPKRVNLLDFRIFEICKCYSIKCVNSCPYEKKMAYHIRRVIVLWNYDVDCEFTVLCWKFRDEDWSPVNPGNHKLNEVVLYDGKCYTIIDCNKYDNFYLMEYKSELYVMLTFLNEGKPSEEDCKEIALEVKIFKKSKSTWEHIKCLGDEVFLLSIDVSVGLSIKDFSGCKGNYVYLQPEKLLPYGRHGNKIEYGVHDLHEGRTSIRKWVGLLPSGFYLVEVAQIDALR